MGNMFAFTGADTYGRFKRLRGWNVFEPIGFDAFGIHSENLRDQAGDQPGGADSAEHRELPAPAPANGSHVRLAARAVHHRPAVLQVDPVDLRRSCSRLDWPTEKAAPVNWCPSCKTVLANEQVINGACERCGTPVEQRDAGAVVLQDHRVRRAAAGQPGRRQWTGPTPPPRPSATGSARSEGAEIDFAARARPARSGSITTRPDTIFGATFMVLAPEHPLVEEITTRERNRTRWRPIARAGRSPGHRLAPGGRTGRRPACSPARSRMNPANGRTIPVWIADYVLMEYGTGAIMAVPGHDERDFEFATALRTADRAGRGARRQRPRSAGRVGLDGVDGVGWSNSGEFTGLPAAEATARDHRVAGGDGRGQGRGATTACTTGASPGSGTGARRSRSSTATPAAPSRCRRAIYRCCCR